MLERILASTRLYDAAQVAVGAGLIRARLAANVGHAEHATVLDVGAGTGLYARCLPASARYVWFDNDVRKLRGYLRRGGGRAVIGDGCCMGLAAKSVDYAMCTGVIHHLDNAQATRLLDELARIVRRGIIVQDATTDSPTLASRVLWTLDKGVYPRSRHELLSMIGRRFRIGHSEEYAYCHRYLLVIAAPACS